MKVRDNLEKLIWYCRENPQPITLARVVMANLMQAREAYEAAQYGIRHGVIVRIARPGAQSNQRVWYRWTGQPLPPIGNGSAPPSFDALLTAWGMAHAPLCLPVAASRTVLSD